VRGDAENRAGAVIHEDEVGHIYRYFASQQRVRGFKARIEAELFGLFDGDFGGAAGLARGKKFFEFGFIAREFLTHGMVGRQRHEGCAEERVGARGEDFDLFFGADDVPFELQALGFSDPVFLHDADFFRPARKVF